MLKELTVLVLVLSLCCEVAWSAPTSTVDLLALEAVVQARLSKMEDLREKAREQGRIKQFANRLRQTNISPYSLAEVVHYLLHPSAGPILNRPLALGVDALRKVLAGKSILSSRQSNQRNMQQKGH